MRWVVNARHRPLYPRERLGAYFIGGLVGLCGCVRKISPPPGFDPWTIHPLTSRYTDWAILNHLFIWEANKNWSCKLETTVAMYNTHIIATLWIIKNINFIYISYILYILTINILVKLIDKNKIYITRLARTPLLQYLPEVLRCRSFYMC